MNVIEVSTVIFRRNQMILWPSTFEKLHHTTEMSSILYTVELRLYFLYYRKCRGTSTKGKTWPVFNVSRNRAARVSAYANQCVWGHKLIWIRYR